MARRHGDQPERDLGSIVRRLRRKQKLSVRKLAAATDFSPSFISQLEHNKVSPSISSLERVATGLGVTLGDFFREASPSIALVRPVGRQRITSEWSRARIEALGPIGPAQRLEPVIVNIAPGGRSGKRAYPYATERFVFVVRGTIRLMLAEVAHTLHPGDAVVIPPGLPHSWENRGRRWTSLVIVSLRPE